ncbi:hypothetical protein BTN50_0894 [Candidatus Enterovibrio altilux]|uniref:Uncharacterized protein n=1 Tax=Candidatus Enterovibrio altilux TaxID=1927128 RepID=A0A291B8T5_9GAMM|nr:hypothetical protein BTN50_0894 [Candidatus Enterovibrio luxaltus]
MATIPYSPKDASFLGGMSGTKRLIRTMSYTPPTNISLIF